MRVPFVDLKAQYNRVRAEIEPAMRDILERSAFIGGAAVADFERRFAEYCGVGHAVGVGNGTDALAIALRSLGVGQGDEVITVANSFIASSEAITMAGAKVVFVDCDPSTYTMDVDKLAKAITPRTKAVIPVHLYGRPADMVEICALARQHGLKVVEDAAQAHGATLGGRRCGSFGDAACFSFYPGKNLGAYGDAGAVVTNDGALAEHIRMIANHGRLTKYDHALEGVNSRLDALQAVVLGVKMNHIEIWTEERRAAAALYREHLAGTGLALPDDPADGRHVYHLFVTRVEDPERVRAALGAAGIDSGSHYPVALPNLSAYRYLGHRPEDFPVASAYQGQLISLPMYPEITAEQVAYVCDHLKKAIFQ